MGEPPLTTRKTGNSPVRARARQASRCCGPRTGRRRRLTGHFSSAHRNDVPLMLLRPGGQPQPWVIVAARVTSMGHRCGCPARLNSIDGTSLRLRARVIAAARKSRYADVPSRLGASLESRSAASSSLNVTSCLSCRGLCCRAASGAVGQSRTGRPGCPGRPVQLSGRTNCRRCRRTGTRRRCSRSGSRDRAARSR